ncbi:MAG: energy-coupling factor transporter transmembrane protein EcfT [archaeon YNP-LCB-003-016]|jgi:energy-coupling factor transport system permease protein|uniref:energy-coupling factor transporter transmembrane component T family protein n=1 Tax=Candidatus Culexarchaeum yellowstonense TaxID=2928963 RepID=UPI0026EAFA15|nr:energy-coupling factor transporter transmembrane component T [Candidatus Culexarchaeum yellowstonense]MCR6690899.1 energy-coupling factor transporter transmembrane protein EcfT [Candidatus Culexarchaeum yellowstonense]
MMTLKAFEFKRGDTIIHRLDPRVKFLLSISYLILSFIYNNFVILLILFLTSIPLFYLAKSLIDYLRSLRGALLFIILVFALNYFVSGLYLALTITLRLILLMSSFSIFFMTTYPEDFALMLVNIGVPYDFALTLTMSIRFVPTLAREAQIIIDAQRSRGLELEKGNFIVKLKNYIPILVPLIVSALRRSMSVAEAMESRAFGASPKRSSLIELSFKRRDYIALFIIVSFTVFMLLLKFYFHIEDYLNLYSLFMG